MDFNDDEKQYGNIIRSLRNLKKVSAPENFEADLMRKINSRSYKEAKSGFWHDILMPSKLIPTAALAVVLIVLYMVKFDNRNTENPLSVQPKVRSDVMMSDGSDSSIDDLIYGRLKKNRSNEKSAQFLSKKENYPSLTVANIKTGLNFRQANITKSQRKEVIALKQKFESMVKEAQLKENDKY